MCDTSRCDFSFLRLRWDRCPDTFLGAPCYWRGTSVENEAGMRVSSKHPLSCLQERGWPCWLLSYQCHSSCRTASLSRRKSLNSSTRTSCRLHNQSHFPRLAKLSKQGWFADIWQFKDWALLVYNWRFYLREMRNLSNPSTLKKHSQSCQTLLVCSLLDYPFLSLGLPGFEQENSCKCFNFFLKHSF